MLRPLVRVVDLNKNFNWEKIKKNKEEQKSQE